MDNTHVPLPKDTPAYFCANCGAVSLDANNLCSVQGRLKKRDWCGLKGVKHPEYCEKKTHTSRWACQNCGQTSVNPELLCKPEKLDIPG